MHSNSQVKKVLDFLRKNPQRDFNATTIDRCLYGGKDYKKDKKRISTIKIILYRLTIKGKICRTQRGFYQAYTDFSLLHQIEHPPTMLHGIMLECKTTNTLQKYIQGIPSNEYTDESIMLLGALGFFPTTNYRYYRDFWFEGRKITVTVHLMGKIDVYINSTKNPISYPDFLKILTYLDGVLEQLAPFSDREVVDLLEVGVANLTSPNRPFNH